MSFVANITAGVSQRVYHPVARQIRTLSHKVAPYFSQIIGDARLGLTNSLSYVMQKLHLNFSASIKALEAPAIGLPQDQPEVSRNMSLAFALGTAAFASIMLASGSAEGAEITTAVAAVAKKGMEFVNLGAVVAGTTVLALVAKLSLSFEFVLKINPLRAAAEFGAKLLPYTLIPTGILAIGTVKDWMLEIGFASSVGLTVVSLISNAVTNRINFQSFRQSHPRLGQGLFVLNRSWKLALGSSIALAMISHLWGSTNIGSFPEGTELKRYLEGAWEMITLFRPGQFFHYREVTLPTLAALLAVFHQLAVRGSDRLPPHSLLRWPSDKTAVFLPWTAYPLLFLTIAYMTLTNESDLGQVWGKWSPYLRTFLLDTFVLVAAGKTYLRSKNTIFTGQGKQFAPADSAVVVEHSLANLQKTTKLAMALVQVPMFLSLTAGLFAKGYSQYAGWWDATKNCGLTALTVYFAFNYVMISAVHAIGSSWGAIKTGEKSLDPVEEPRIFEAFYGKILKMGANIRVLAASKDPQPTALVQMPKMLINDFGHGEHVLAVEQHPHDRQPLDGDKVVPHYQSMRAHLEYIELIRQYQREIRQFILRKAEPFFRAVAEGRVAQADLPKYYQMLAETYQAIGRRLSCDAAEEFSREFSGAQIAPGDGSDFETRPSWQAVLRQLEALDAQRPKFLRWFEPFRQPYRYNLDGAFRIRAEKLLTAARDLQDRAERGVELTETNLKAQFKYLLDIYSVSFKVNLRHILKQDDRAYNKIANLANPHTYEGDTTYKVWTLSPNRGGKTPLNFFVEDVPALWILVENPDCSGNPHETDEKKKYRYHWVHRDNFKKALKHSSSWSDEHNLIDNTPDPADPKLTLHKMLVRVNGQEKLVEAYGTNSPAILPMRRIIPRTNLSPEHRRIMAEYTTWVAGEQISPAKRQAFMLAFETWFKKRLGPDAKVYEEWLKVQRQKDPHALWYVPEPDFTYYLGPTNADDTALSTVDEEHLNINHVLEAQMQKDTGENAVTMVTFYYLLTRFWAHPDPSRGLPTRILGFNDAKGHVEVDLK